MLGKKQQQEGREQHEAANDTFWQCGDCGWEQTFRHKRCLNILTDGYACNHERPSKADGHCTFFKVQTKNDDKPKNDDRYTSSDLPRPSLRRINKVLQRVRPTRGTTMELREVWDESNSRGIQQSSAPGPMTSLPAPLVARDDEKPRRSGSVPNSAPHRDTGGEALDDSTGERSARPEHTNSPESIFQSRDAVDVASTHEGTTKLWSVNAPVKGTATTATDPSPVAEAYSRNKELCFWFALLSAATLACSAATLVLQLSQPLLLREKEVALSVGFPLALLALITLVTTTKVGTKSHDYICRWLDRPARIYRSASNPELLKDSYAFVTDALW